MSADDVDARLASAWWDEQLALLRTSDGSSALALRDQLARTNVARLVRELGISIASESSAPSDRVKAAWLLKDLCNEEASPYLEAGLFSFSGTSELREQILDTLERLAFAARLPRVDLRRMARSLSAQNEIDKLIALLVSIGSEEAREILGEYGRDPEIRPRLLRVISDRPGNWIDSFLAALRAENVDDVEVQAIVEDREYRGLQARLRAPDNHDRVNGDLLHRLWQRRDVSLIRRLAAQGRLENEAADLLSRMTDDALSKSERKLLAQAKGFATSAAGGAPNDR